MTSPALPCLQESLNLALFRDVMRQQRSSSPAAATKSGKGKEKEKRTEKGRDGRKEKEATEGDATTTGHQFFKVFFPEQSGERLVTYLHITDYSSCLLDEYSCNNKTRTRSKDVPRMGQFASKKFRQPVVISQRRPITEEEKNQALIRAKEFKSKSPFAVQVMMESYVYVGFFLKIPCEFVRESLPRTSTKMTLWDPQGTSWEVNYVYYNDRSVAAFSGGWGKFAIGNNLEKFDVCVFELFKEDNIKVHIYRVVPEIAPLIRNKVGECNSIYRKKTDYSKAGMCSRCSFKREHSQFAKQISGNR